MNELLIFRNEVRHHLTSQLLPFWMTRMLDEGNGGFYGRIGGDGVIDFDADKGVVLNARILWTFAAAYRQLGDSDYLTVAKRAKNYIQDCFVDKAFGGLYWSVNSKGAPRDTKKQIYAQGFGIYGFSEYYRATGDESALQQAIALYRVVERYSFDPTMNGYFEAFSREWGDVDDVRLSDKDDNARKTMNTHLHILEPYTNLYRVWKDESLRRQLHNMITLFLDKIVDSTTYHLNLFFDADWRNRRSIFSFGHDIEAAWLLHEAALVLNDAVLLQRVLAVVPRIVKAAEEGWNEDGSLVYELDVELGHTDADRHWWVQAEAVVGFLNQYQYFGDVHALRKGLSVWSYIRTKLIDQQHGEWYWSVRSDGGANRMDDLAGFWKCPYHNSRMCFEVLERLDTV